MSYFDVYGYFYLSLAGLNITHSLYAKRYSLYYRQSLWRGTLLCLCFVSIPFWSLSVGSLVTFTLTLEAPSGLIALRLYVPSS